MTEALLEAYQLVNDKLIGKHDFKHFTFENTRCFLGEASPISLLARPRKAPCATVWANDHRN